MAKSRSSIAQKAANPGKKYDKALLKCTKQECSNEFYVSEASTPAVRVCYTCFTGKAAPKPTNTKLANTLRSLGFAV